MNKNILFISLFLLVALSTQQNKSCDNTYNTLLKSDNNPYGPEGLTQPQTVTGLTFCKAQLEGKLSCCSAATINSLDGKLKSQINVLNEDAKQLDNNAIEFMQATAAVQLEAKNYTQEAQTIISSISNSSRILLQVFERVLQTPPPQPPQGNTTNQQPAQGNTTNQQPPQGNTTNQQPAPGSNSTQRPANGSNSTQQPPQGGQGQQQPSQGGQGQQQPSQGGQGQQQPSQGGQGQQQPAQGGSNKPPAMNQTLANKTQQQILSNIIPQGQGQQQGQQQGSQQGQQQKQQANLNQQPKAEQSLSNLQKQLKVDDSKNMKEIMQRAVQARARCFKYLGKLKSQFACMACDYSNITAALNSGSLSLSSSICSDIQSNCYDYAFINQNVSLLRNKDQMKQQLVSIQQQRLQLNQIRGNITQMNQLLQQDGVNSTNQTQQQITAGVQQLGQKQANDTSVNSTFQAKSLPASCTSNTTCEYLCSHLINLAYGGVDFQRAQSPGENITIDISNSSSVQQLNNKALQPGGGNNVAPPQQPPRPQGQQGQGQGQPQQGQGQPQQGQGQQEKPQQPQPNQTNQTNQTQIVIKGSRMLQLTTTATFTASGATIPDSGLTSVVEASVVADPAQVDSVVITASLDNIVTEGSTTSSTTKSNNGSLLGFCLTFLFGFYALLY